MAAPRKRTKTSAGTAADGASKAKKPRAPRKAKRAPGSRGLTASEVASGPVGVGVDELARAVESEGGAVIGRYRDPLGGHGVVIASLPLEKVEPTPFQRDLSDAHATRLAKAIEDLDRFLDPIVVVLGAKGGFWTPNGNHRREALRRLGAKSIVAIVVPEREVAYRILALNTEKAHNLREKALEVVRMARDLCQVEPRPEVEYAVTFEEPALLTLGLCYETRPRFSGGAYHSALKRGEEFLALRLPQALEKRADRARRLFELDDAVVKTVEALKARGFESPYLKNYVVARIDPLRFRRGAKADLDETLATMLAAAKSFDVAKVKADQIARSGGAPAAAEG